MWCDSLTYNYVERLPSAGLHNQSVNFIVFIFQLKDGLSWHLHALHCKIQFQIDAAERCHASYYSQACLLTGELCLQCNSVGEHVFFILDLELNMQALILSTWTSSSSLNYANQVQDYCARLRHRHSWKGPGGG